MLGRYGEEVTGSGAEGSLPCWEFGGPFHVLHADLFVGSRRLLIGRVSSFIDSQGVRVLMSWHLLPFPPQLAWHSGMQTSHTPTLTHLSLSYLCAIYLRAKFETMLSTSLSSTSATLLDQPLNLLVALASELDIIAATLVDALSNPSQWNKTYSLTHWTFIGSSSKVGWYTLYGEAFKNAFKARNKGIYWKGSIAKTAISPTEWSYGLKPICYCWHG